jgi:N-acyl-L-homoserine lactone synthetase
MNATKTTYYSYASDPNTVFMSRTGEYVPDAAVHRTRRQYEEYTQAALRALIAAPGARLYTQVMTVSRSGMQRRIRLYVVQDSRIRNVSYMVSGLLQWRHDRNLEAVVVDGVGMDMCFHLVYTLSHVLGIPTDACLRADHI